MEVRTRFAPSPTGFLHMGGVRTALYSWLFARQQGGKFVLRIEDTDRARQAPEAVEVIRSGLAWLGLSHDEGPIYQSDRFPRYEAVLQGLLDQEQAYYCDCTPERLDQLRVIQRDRREKPRYDGHCRNRQLSKTADRLQVIRFKNPHPGSVTFHDAVHGNIRVNNSELDDLILQRSDGTPTYNFCVVVDDWDFKISMVIRGDDHLANTPRQINLYEALGANPPRFAHLPMILGSDGQRLSKRHGAQNVLAYREAGYVPEALLNYLLRLGWAHGNQEIFSKEEMIQLFDLPTPRQSNSWIISSFEKIS